MAEAAAKLTGPEFRVEPSQGSYSGGVSASAGTHDAGGALDIKAVNLTSAQRQEVVKAFRKVGFAAWLRTPSQSNWPYHVHCIAVQPWGMHDRGVLTTAAHQQVIDYMNGRNGLASHARDDGPRDWVGEIWEHYKNPHPTVDLANLRYGKANSDVKAMQRALHFHHQYVLCDGQYGPQTETQVLRCQRDHGFGNDRPRHSFVGRRQAEHLGLTA